MKSLCENNTKRRAFGNSLHKEHTKFMWNVNVLEWQKKNNENKYLQCKQNKRISVLHTLMNESMIEKYTPVFNIRHHV
jgi:hypothetical protein